MQTFIIASVIILFVALLGLNIFFKANVIKTYKFLTQQNVDVSVGQLISRKRLKQEVLPRYPKHGPTLSSLSNKFRFCIIFALTIIIVIALLGFSLLFV